MIHRDASSRTLGLARILVFGIWIIAVCRLPIEDLAALPGLERHGVLRLLPDAAWASLLDRDVLAAFRFGLLVPLAWLVLGLGPFRPVALLTALALTVFDGIAKSHGPFLNHGESMSLYAVYLLALFPCADGAALVRRRRPRAGDVRYAAPLMLVAAMMTLLYSFVAANRIGEAGLAFFTSDSLGVYLLDRGLEHSVFQFTMGLDVVRGGWLEAAKLGFVVVTACELTSPLLLFFRGYRWLWLAVMVPFHIGTVVLMNILFWQNLLLIGFFLTDWESLLSGLRRRASLRGRDRAHSP